MRIFEQGFGPAFSFWFTGHDLSQITSQAADFTLS
jgi:hypothetical protein